MRQKLLAMAGALALLAVLGKYYAQPVLAQVRAALVQDVDNAARHFVRLSFTARQPFGEGGQFLCSDFYTVPSGQRLVVDNVGIRTSGAPSNLATLTQTFTTSAAGCNSPQYLATKKQMVMLPANFQGTSPIGFGIYGNNQRVQT